MEYTCERGIENTKIIEFVSDKLMDNHNFLMDRMTHRFILIISLTSSVSDINSK